MKSIQRGTAVGVVLVIMAAAGSAPPVARADVRCGKVHDLVVQIEKGGGRCDRARSLMRHFIAKNSKPPYCGSSHIRACEFNAWHCRVALSTERPRKGYCYILEEDRPARRDYSVWRPGKFRRAISLRTD